MPKVAAEEVELDDELEHDEGPVERSSTGNTSPIKALAKAEEATVSDWISSLGDHGPIKIYLERREPKKYKGIKTSGSLGVYDDLFSLEDIEQEHGGGKYFARVQREVIDKNGKRRWQYASGKMFEIAGVPRLESLDREVGNDKPAPSQDSNNVTQVLTAAQQLIDKANERADKANDPRLLDALLGPMRDQMNQLSAQNRELQAQLLAKMGEKPDRSSEDKVLSLWDRSNDESSRRLTEAHREHEKELRQLRDYHYEDIKRREDAHARALERAHDDAKQKIEIMRESAKQALDTMKQTYEMRISGLEDAIRRVEAEKAEARAEVVALRAKKEQGPLEQVQALAALKNGMESVFGSNKDDEEDEPTWVKAMNALGMDNLVGGIAQRISSGPRPPAGEGQQQLVTVQGPNGETAQVTPEVAEAIRQRQEQAKREAEGTRLDPNAVRRALTFMESAYRAGTPPESFAQTARSMIPKDIVKMLSERGPEAGADHILDEYTDGSSELNTVAGRQWARKVVRCLLGYGDEAPATAPAPEQADPEDDDIE